MELRQGERLIRTDIVNTNSSVLGQPRLAVMTLTSERVILAPPNVSRRYRWFAWTGGQLTNRLMAPSDPPHWGEPRHRFRPPIGETIIIELSAIVKIWAWVPRLSAPPWLQTRHSTAASGWFAGGGYDVQLLEGIIPWQKRASLAAIEDHLSAIEQAWAAAVSGAPKEHTG